MERQVGSITLRILEGDICDRAVDAIVNAANNQLWMGGGGARPRPRAPSPSASQSSRVAANSRRPTSSTPP